ncbi:hypothetical protein GCM10007052_32020 [Halioglobus japonicus]|uniref:HNH endonuclease signature motif containing protein n=1 Tax=Halioglobus japonicus TaxID=930805 RepID=UPI0012F519B8|nr:HNH endonuclease signature motif containing protein [Halioglobus japonicus]GHD21345.1 hypothetical protein GCM10007052_32020 [Halioglobus japonicus]
MWCLRASGGHWSEGGETSLDNLVTLCRFHHRQLHRGRMEVVKDDVSAEILFVETPE